MLINRILIQSDNPSRDFMQLKKTYDNLNNNSCFFNNCPYVIDWNFNYIDGLEIDFYSPADNDEDFFEELRKTSSYFPNLYFVFKSIDTKTKETSYYEYKDGELIWYEESNSKNVENMESWYQYALSL